MGAPTISPRLKKLIGSLGVLAFLAAYIWAVSAAAAHLPHVFALQLAFYVLTGVSWGVPIIPLITWMNREPPKPVDDDGGQV